MEKTYRKYDPRLRNLVATSANLSRFILMGIPKSTLREWQKKGQQEFITLPEFDLTATELIQQLRAVVESLAGKIDGDVIREKDIFQVLPEAMSIMTTKSARRLIGGYGAAVVMNERDRFERAIIRAKGDRSQASIMLGISRATFFRRAMDLGLVRPRGA